MKTLVCSWEQYLLLCKYIGPIPKAVSPTRGVKMGINEHANLVVFLFSCLQPGLANWRLIE